MLNIYIYVLSNLLFLINKKKFKICSVVNFGNIYIIVLNTSSGIFSYKNIVVSVPFKGIYYNIIL